MFAYKPLLCFILTVIPYNFLNAMTDSEKKDKNQFQKIAESIKTGVRAGAFEVTCSQGLVYWKNMREQNLPVSLNPKQWYRGFAPNILGVVPLMAIQTGSYTFFEEKFGHWDLKYKDSLAAFTSGIASTLVASPSELFTLLLQNKKSTLKKQISYVYGTGGLRGFTRGMTTASLIYSLVSLGYLNWGPHCGYFLNKHLINNQKVAETLGGLLVGIAVGCAIQPFDVIKTCMQADVEKKKYKGLFQTAGLLYKEGTYKAFSRGILPSILRIVFAIPLQSLLTKDIRDGNS